MANPDGGGRPRSKMLVRLDLNNAYARLGVSPLMSTDDIKDEINRRRKEVMRRRRTRGEQQFGEEEAEMTRLQEIEDEIGSPKDRARYDRANPQNALLTVQPGPADAWLDPKRRAGLATAWLVEELGQESLLPSPQCLAFWAPGGLAPDTAAFLTKFLDAPAGPAAAIGPATPLEVAELGRIVAQDGESSTAAGGPSADGPIARTADAKEGLPDV